MLLVILFLGDIVSTAGGQNGGNSDGTSGGNEGISNGGSGGGSQETGYGHTNGK